MIAQINREFLIDAVDSLEDYYDLLMDQEQFDEAQGVKETLKILESAIQG